MTKLKGKDAAYAHGSGNIKSRPSLSLLRVLLKSVKELGVLIPVRFGVATNLFSLTARRGKK